MIHNILRLLGALAFSGATALVHAFDVPSLHAKGEAIGELGGQKVKIPKEYAKFLEYDGDPHFLERKANYNPTRSYESKISSFGFDARYPDMAGLTSATAADYKVTVGKANSFWMWVGVNSGSRYDPVYGSNYLEEHSDIKTYHENTLKLINPAYFYEKQPTLTHGLETYIAKGMSDELKRDKLLSLTKNIHIYRDIKQRVTTIIVCSNSKYDASQCRARFFAQGSKTHLSVSFRRGLLPEWRNIQAAVRDKVSSFYIVNQPQNPAQQ